MIDHDLTNTLAALSDSETAGFVAAVNAPARSPLKSKAIVPSITAFDLQAAILRSSPENAERLKKLSGSTARVDMDNVYRARSLAEVRANPSAYPWFETDSARQPTGKFNIKIVTSADGKLVGVDYYRRDDPAIPHAKTADIGDARNDENRIIAGIQGLFMLFHNVCIDSEHAQTPGKTPDQLFRTCQTNVRQVFQTIVLTDFLPRVSDAATLGKLIGESAVDPDHVTLPKPGAIRTPLYACRLGDNTKMPLEFAVAGFRLGHSLLRNQYAIRDGVYKPLFEPNDNEQRNDLVGGRVLDPSEVIDWGLFFGSNPMQADDPGRAQHANALDTHIALAVARLPKATVPMVPDPLRPAVMVPDTDTELNLPRRNVERAAAPTATISGGASIPSGEGMAALAARLGVTGIKTLTASEKAGFIGPAARAKTTPLWLYVLGEAQYRGGGQHLGVLGTQIVADTILATSRCDGTSVVNSLAANQSTWVPIKAIKATRRYSMPAMIKYLQSQGHFALSTS